MNDHSIILNKARKSILPVMQKLERMEEIYINKTRGLYSKERIKEIKDILSATRFKYFLSFAHLEELWALSESHRFILPNLIENSVKEHKWEEDDHTLGSMFLEAFLFQARAFIDIFMRAISLIMNEDPPVYMSYDKFKKLMKSVKGDNFKDRAHNVLAIFENDVFGENKWGFILKSLRDKIAHRDQIKPRYEGEEEICSIRLDWPTIRKMTFDRFAQDIQNGIFNLIRNTASHIFCLDWKSGEYDANAWDN